METGTSDTAADPAPSAVRPRPSAAGAGSDPALAPVLPPDDVILAHDWLVGMRGGERVLERLAQRYGPTDLYCLVADGRPHADAIDACRVHCSPLQRLPGAAGGLRRHFLPLMPWAVGRLRPRACRLVLSTSSAVMKSIRPPAGAVHVCYCHSPARYAWEQTDEYATGRGGLVRRLGLAAIGPRFRRWDRRTADRVDRFIANSRHTAARIERVFGREAVVVHPPVRTEWFAPDPGRAREDWFLVVAALEPYKRVDLVIEAAIQAGCRLRVAGTGSQAGALADLVRRHRADDRVELLGRVDDPELRGLYQGARALIFPQLEDFGIVPVEALACGCPVLAYDAGGARDSVTAEVGELVATQSAEAFAEAMTRWGRGADGPTAEACRAQAERFAADRFDAGIDAVIRDALSA